MSRRIDPFVRAHSKMHARFGSVMIPAKDIVEAAVNFSQSLLFENQDGDHPLTVFGTSFLISYRSTLIQIASDHQVQNSGRDPVDVCIPATNGLRTDILTSTGVYRFTPKASDLDSLRDVRIWTYDVAKLPVLSSRFFSHIIRSVCGCSSKRRRKSVCILHDCISAKRCRL